MLIIIIKLIVKEPLAVFYRTCRTLAVIWGVVFLIATGMSAMKTCGWWAGGLGYQAASWGLIGSGLWLNHWYPQQGRAQKKLQERH